MQRAKVRHLVPQALAVAVALVLGLVAAGGTAQAAENYGYQSISYTGVANTPTSDKPQSKLWWNDGSWWADMWTTGTGWQIYRLDRAAKTWVNTGVSIDTRSNTLADTLWDGSKLYIASHVVTVSGDSSTKASVSGQPAKLYRYSYAAGKYTLDAGFPTNINNNSSESMTIDKDTTGAVWATWTQVSGSSTSGYTSSVYVNSSAAGGANWGTPFVLPVTDPNPAPDDISAIVSYGSNKIGVLWSDAPAGTVYWATRTDGTSPSAASSWKVQPAVQGKGQADDHLNIKALLADPSGRVYAAVKTSLDSSTDKTLPQLQLLVFRPGTGSFTRSTIATLADCVTRPQILLDTTNNVVRAFHTAPSTSTSGCAYSGVPGSIYEKTASMDNPVFGSGRGTPVIQDGASANINDVTTTKQGVNATTGVVVMASNKATSRYWFSDRSLGTAPAPGDTAAPTVTGTSPVDGATGVAVSTNVTATFSEVMNTSTITSNTFTLKAGTTTVPASLAPNSTGSTVTLNPGTDLAAGTTYTATIKGGSTGVKDAAGNALATDKTWTFTTAAASGGGTSETVTLTATADSWVAGGATATNYGTSTTLSVDNSPVEATYLKFDLSAYAGRTLESATLQLRSAGSGSTGKQNMKLVADDSWTEGGITYNNRPTPGTTLGTLGPTTANASYSVPLTVSGLTGELGQQLSLGLDATSTDGLDLNSREAGSTTAPKLVITMSGSGSGGGSTDTAAPAVTGTSPAAGATGVAVSTNVTATFSEAMNTSTITSDTFTLKTGTTTVAAAVTYSGTGNTATLNPGTDLAAGTFYTATIKGGSTGVKDAAGNALATDKTWTFTTAAASGGGTSETVTLTATADSWVAGGAANTNYGTSTTLSVDNSPVEITYLKFDLSPYAGRTVESATLQLRSAGSGSIGKQNIKLVTDDSWAESTLTYNNRPALGTSIGTLGPTAANSNYSVPLTVTGLASELGQQLSLGLDATSTDGLDLNSREAGSTTAPKLVLTLR
ncbi:Ig-like domain-containing protein [Arthrobacter sp. AK04]|uniref:CBM96 family carbohydrate-binding protein n=1 Tax=Arthrobacter sp. AK04 TaxID=2900048 RepID=UPI001E4BEEBB|nr:Ig-like domain-containing protein [Arthrobacter sp. AK04]MCD5341127.1 Ig-like domain-containing protein [Arthrobacter sp. AK04]